MRILVVLHVSEFCDDRLIEQAEVEGDGEGDRGSHSQLSNCIEAEIMCVSSWCFTSVNIVTIG